MNFNCKNCLYSTNHDISKIIVSETKLGYKIQFLHCSLNKCINVVCDAYECDEELIEQ